MFRDVESTWWCLAVLALATMVIVVWLARRASRTFGVGGSVSGERTSEARQVNAAGGDAQSDAALAGSSLAEATFADSPNDAEQQSVASEIHAGGERRSELGVTLVLLSLLVMCMLSWGAALPWMHERYVLSRAGFEIQTAAARVPASLFTHLHGAIGRLRERATRVVAARPISDDDMEVLRGRHRIEVLVITNTAVTDAGLAVLETLPQLTTLDASKTQITDRGIEHLAKLTQLKHLNLARTTITGVGLIHLQDAPLTELRLSDGAMSDAGLRYIATMHSLKLLSLARTDVTGEGLGHLSSLHQLEHLALDGCDIHDDQLEPLGMLTSLHTLKLRSTSVTDAGGTYLQQRLVNVEDLRWTHDEARVKSPAM